MATDKDMCEIHLINKEKVENLKNSLEDEEILRLAELYRAMGDGTRIKILHALSQEELCVCDIAALVDMSQSAISHQLRILRSLRLVKYRKEGKMVYYSLDDEHIINLFAQGLAHIRHN
ncbi:MAG: metalloregulator ArsR/SmtB family transcription factor [Bacillota bacterium]